MQQDELDGLLVVAHDEQENESGNYQRDGSGDRVSRRWQTVDVPSKLQFKGTQARTCVVAPHSPRRCSPLHHHHLHHRTPHTTTYTLS